MSHENKWSASKYRANKAKRREQITPEWVTNPETGAEFLVRKVGAMAHMIAGVLPSALTATAATAWKEQGVGVDAEGQSAPQLDEALRDLQLIGKVVMEACVTPKLTLNPQNEDELDPAELDDLDIMFIFRYATGQVGAVAMKGGKTADIKSLESFRKKPGRRDRTRDDSEELQSATG